MSKTQRGAGSVLLPRNNITWVVAVMLSLALMARTSWAVSGSFFTHKNFQNVLPADEINDFIEPSTQASCENHCVKDNVCTAYAFNSSLCELYNVTVGGPPPFLINNTLTLYMLAKDPSYVIVPDELMFYYRLYTTRLNAFDANKVCAAEGGMLAAVTDFAISRALQTALTAVNCWKAFIGVTDELVELQFLYFNNVTAVFQNWSWKGVWPDRVRNCAVINFDGEVSDKHGKWTNVNCWNHFEFFCQIPMF